MFVRPRQPIELGDDQGITIADEIESRLKLRSVSYGRHLFLENDHTETVPETTSAERLKTLNFWVVETTYNKDMLFVWVMP